MIEEVFCWPGLREDVKSFCFRCLSCLKASPGKLIPRPLGTSIKATRPCEVISMDYFHLFPLHETVPSFCLIIRDSLSTFCELSPSHRGTSTDAAKALTLFFSRYGYNVDWCMSDRGSHFVGEVFKELCSFLNIKQNLHCAWRPESSGILERQHRTLKDALYIVSKELDQP